MFGFLRSFNIKKLVLSIKQSRPNVAVAIVVFFVFLFQAFSSRKDYGIDDKLRESVSNDIVQIFVQKDCPYCYKMKQYIESNDFSNYDIRFYDLGISKNSELLVQNVLLYKIDTKKSFGTPIIFYKNSYTMGFAGGEDGEKMFLDFLESRENIKDGVKKTLKMPFLGEVELANLPLSVLSILMGLANGFNFCTAWIFVYLLSIIVALKDKKKTRILVGSFLISSGILYYLFLAAWLNVFLFIGYLRILNLLIGSSALYFGVITICEFVKNNQDNKIGIEPVGKVKELVGENISFVMLFGIMFLAFTVGSTNFSCSATLPATYTYMLTKANLSIIQYYAFILLYTVMYMLDDLLMFSCAIFALNNCTGKKYKKYSAMIGGILMLLIGISVVFFPNLLR